MNEEVWDMSVTVISNNYYQLIKKFIVNAHKSIKIISPFIGEKMADLLCKSKSNFQDLQVNVITRFYEHDFCKGVSSIFGLQKLNDNGVNLFALKKLHTKLYIFDDETAMVGSANFTTGGFHINNELLLLVQNEPELMKELLIFFNNIYETTNPDFAITTQKISDTINKIKLIIQKPQPFEKGYELDNNFGAEPPLMQGLPDHSNRCNKSDDISSSQEINQIWLKFEDSSRLRAKATDTYSPHIWQDSYVTSFSPNKGKPSVKSGDIVYLAVISKDNNDNNTQHIIGRGIFDGTVKEASQSMKDKYDWMNHYSYYCNIKGFEYINTNIGNGVLLNAIINDLGKNFYIATQSGKSDPYKAHYQKSHIRITEIARASIDSKLELLFRTYGCINKIQNY